MATSPTFFLCIFKDLICVINGYARRNYFNLLFTTSHYTPLKSSIVGSGGIYIVVLQSIVQLSG